MSRGGEEKGNWKESVFFLHDASFCKHEEDPPEQAILVFISPLEVEVKTQVFLCGGAVAVAGFAQGMIGAGAPRVYRMGRAKMAILTMDTYTLGLSGSVLEPDESLAQQLEFLFAAFQFFHGSFNAVKKASRFDRKRLCSTMTRIWARLLGYLRPGSAAVDTAFHALPRYPLRKATNRIHVVASQVMGWLDKQEGLLASAILRNRSFVCSCLPANVAKWVLALLQPTHATSYGEEDNRRIQLRARKIRDMMLKDPRELIRKREYRLKEYFNCFVGNEFVDFLLEKGEASSREAAIKLGRKLMHLGIIHHVVNEHEFADSVKYYRFKVDEIPDINPNLATALVPPPQQPQQALQRTPSTASASGAFGAWSSVAGKEGIAVSASGMRSLVLSGHGRDAKLLHQARGLVDLPPGVHILPVYIRKEVADELRGRSTMHARRPAQARASTTSAFLPSELNTKPATPSAPQHLSSDGSHSQSPAIPSEASSGVPSERPANADSSAKPPTLSGLDVSELPDVASSAPELGSDGLPIHPPPPPPPSSTDLSTQETLEKAQEALARLATGAASSLSAEEEKELDSYLALRQLSAYKQLLVNYGYRSAEELRNGLLNMNPNVLDALLEAYDGENKRELQEALDQAGKQEHAAAAAKAAELVAPPGFECVDLLLLGLQTTVAVALLTSRSGEVSGEESQKEKERDNERITNLTKKLYEMVEECETVGASCGAGDEVDAAFASDHPQLPSTSMQGSAPSNSLDEIPPYVGKYNFLKFSSSTHALQGWCSTNWSTEESKFVPDTDIDRAFADAVHVMHDDFHNRIQQPVTEMCLRKNYNSGIYGRKMFGVETYFQLRQPAVDQLGRNYNRPFDNDFAKLPALAKTSLRNDQGLQFL